MISLLLLTGWLEGQVLNMSALDDAQGNFGEAQRAENAASRAHLEKPTTWGWMLCQNLLSRA